MPKFKTVDCYHETKGCPVTVSCLYTKTAFSQEKEKERRRKRAKKKHEDEESLLEYQNGIKGQIYWDCCTVEAALDAVDENMSCKVDSE